MGVAALLVAGVASLFMAWTVGANSNSAPISPAVGADALSPRRAALLVGVVAAAGALTQGGAVSETMGHGFVHGVTLTPLATTAILLVSASFIAAGNRYGYPIPVAFTVTGATLGAGVALGGAVATDTLLSVLAFWGVIPVVEVVIAFAVAYVLVVTRVPDAESVPVIAFVVAAVFALAPLTVLNGASLASVAGAAAPDAPAVWGVSSAVVAAVAGLSLAVAAVTAWFVHRYRHDGVRGFLVALGLLVVFTSGGTQVALAVGPLLPAVASLDSLSLLAVLALGAFGILVGAWTAAPRLISAVADDYATLGPYRSIAALVPAFLVAEAAIALGYPLSFNKVMISGVVGAGLVDGVSGVSEGKTAKTAVAWVGSMVAAAATAYAFYVAAELLLA
ncbi:inorganic phosphate transporter [Halocalculus aciditolerans]|uniref:Phosphate transporter n=1 Tax=Halocalculus aciditolerans TaxID=1383812 RepID=A0A830F7P3_9EURY|nr:inorganic phosphate transporter [Halocalculus aciditolerans]GGL47291.1 sodium-dependent phosphate transporter [Halocalculus aciditolerans]